MGCKVSDFSTRGGVTLLATKANQDTFSTDETWYTHIDDYDLIVLNCIPYINSTYGALSGCFIPTVLKDILERTGTVRILMSNKYSNTELACLLGTTNAFNLFGASYLYIYGIKVGSEKQ